MSMDYIRNTYGVPAKRGGRVEYTNGKGEVRAGTITGVDGQYLRIRLDGQPYSNNYHPTWNLKYQEQQ